MTKKALEAKPKAAHKVLVDSMVAVENIKRFVGNQGYSIKAESNGEEFVLLIKNR